MFFFNRNKTTHGQLSEPCEVCDGSEFIHKQVLWDKLIKDWQLSNIEAQYIDEQQGKCCTNCESNIRSIALAKAIKSHFDYKSNLLEFCNDQAFNDIKLLEINEAGKLTRFLKNLKQYHFGAYPELDMHSIPFEENTFDLVVHSDTLEHVPNPIHALTECRRVLKKGGALCFTIPIVMGRMSRSRLGLSNSHHSNSKKIAHDYLVHTEYGADFWVSIFEAGFSSLNLSSYEYPAGIALTATK
jgi:SAM-dependent methyltransferase